MSETKDIICVKCQKKLEPARVYLSYLGHSFYAELPKCPQCGEVYISEALVKNRIAEAEKQLEDK